nr:protein PMR5-like [Ipomoea batatas]GME12580.1 protein PMR5-like [Ipomoea batatas]
MYGRPDTDYLKYRWKPANCDVPRFNGLDFLGRMRGKTVMFVGDSLGLNQWESLICMVSAFVPRSQTKMIRGDPLSAFKFLGTGGSTKAISRGGTTWNQKGSCTKIWIGWVLLKRV